MGKKNVQIASYKNIYKMVMEEKMYKLHSESYISSNQLLIPSLYKYLLIYKQDSASWILMIPEVTTEGKKHNYTVYNN